MDNERHAIEKSDAPILLSEAAEKIGLSVTTLRKNHVNRSKKFDPKKLNTIRFGELGYMRVLPSEIKRFIETVLYKK